MNRQSGDPNAQRILFVKNLYVFNVLLVFDYFMLDVQHVLSRAAFLCVPTAIMQSLAKTCTIFLGNTVRYGRCGWVMIRR